jgi:hypothetical protein
MLNSQEIILKWVSSFLGVNDENKSGRRTKKINDFRINELIRYPLWLVLLNSKPIPSALLRPLPFTYYQTLD